MDLNFNNQKHFNLQPFSPNPLSYQRNISPKKRIQPNIKKTIQNPDLQSSLQKNGQIGQNQQQAKSSQQNKNTVAQIKFPYQNQTEAKKPMNQQNLKNQQIIIKKQQHHQEKKSYPEKLQFKTQEVKRNKKQFICGICQSEYELGKEGKMLNCKHIFCNECLKNWLESLIQDGKFKTEELICPDSGCGFPIEKDPQNPLQQKFQLICNIIDQKFLTKLERWRKDNTINCPNPYGCHNKIMVENKKKARCSQCSYNFCFKCLKVAHAGECSLEDVLKEVHQNGMDLRKCPNCHNWATKDERCEHVTCNECHKE